MFREIGSEFWLLEDIQGVSTELPEGFKLCNFTVLTTLGRGAISILLDNIEPVIKIKKVLLPSYICDSVINPFIEKGYQCLFYPITSNLEPDLNLLQRFNFCKIGVFLHLGYFGFHTNKNLETFLTKIKNQSVIIVEDISHTLFSNICKSQYNDFFIGSIRKWAGMPSGGFLTLNQPFHEEQPLLQNTTYVTLREKALRMKGEFLNTLQPSLKKEYLKLFKNAQRLMNEDNRAYKIDSVSLNIIFNLDINFLIAKRRRNFFILLNTIKDVRFIEPVFTTLPINVTPLFFPVFCHTGRERLRSFLVKKEIYCSIHWPTPKSIVLSYFPESEKIYNTILSIPCDQRYEETDMLRIAEVLKSYQLCKPKSRL